MRFDDRGPSDARANRALPVPSGIRQFRLTVPASLPPSPSVSLSLLLSLIPSYIYRSRRAQTRHSDRGDAK